MSRRATTQLPPNAKIGAKLGLDLTVLGVIDGGSAEPVYIVWHHDAWCAMACKVMRSPEEALAQSAVIESFAHPNIVTSLGVLPPRYLLMPFLEGPRLSDLIDQAPRKRLGISDALRVAIHIGAALNHIHQKGYIHLDVKPDNVIVTPGGRPVLFDFGTARSRAAPRPGRVIGTNAYIAPEECERLDVTPAADVFSLGVTLYEMLTGAVPFPSLKTKDAFPQTTGVAAPIARHRVAVPAKLQNLISACLEKNPSFRPELAELLPALNQLITRGPKMWPETFDPSASHKRRDLLLCG